MLKISGKKPTETVFKNIVREVVREEIKPVEERLIKGLDIKFSQFKDEIIFSIKAMLTDFRSEMAGMKDEIISELVKSREETTILKGDHQRVLDLEDKMEDLEKIHPQGQHPTI